MSLFDLILLLILFGFILYGFWFGLIQTFGSVVGVVAGAFLASRWYEPLSQQLEFLFFDHGNIARVVLFFVLFVLINRLVGFAFYFVERVFRIIAIIPFLKSINRLAGAALGLIEGSLVLGAALYVASRYSLGPWFDQPFAASQIAKPLIATVYVLIPLFPEALKQLQTWIPWLTF